MPTNNNEGSFFFPDFIITVILKQTDAYLPPEYEIVRILSHDLLLLPSSTTLPELALL
jgi:hypothetical protein